MAKYVFITLVLFIGAGLADDISIYNDDKRQIRQFEQKLNAMMAELKPLEERTRKEKFPRDPHPLIDDEASHILDQILIMAEQSPVNMAKALEDFMLNNPAFKAGGRCPTFRYAYMYLVFRDNPTTLRHRFNVFLANSQLSDMEAYYLVNATMKYPGSLYLVDEAVFLRRMASCLKIVDVIIPAINRKGVVVEKRFCDSAYKLVRARYRNDLPALLLFSEERQTFAQRDPLIAAARDFVAKKLARLDAVDALEKDLREQATLQLSPAEYDGVLQAWQKLGGGTAPDAELTLTLDNLFVQAALNAKRAPSERDQAMTRHLAARARELLQKDKVEIAPLEESAIRSPDGVWTWFRNPLAVRVYKQRDPLNPHRDVALEKFLKDYEARHDKGELFRDPQEPAAPADKPEKTARPAAKR